MLQSELKLLTLLRKLLCTLCEVLCIDKAFFDHIIDYMAE